MLIDITGTVAADLRADDALLAAFGGKVFADVAPAGTEPPFAVVRNNGAGRPFEAPTWDRLSVLIDVVGDPGDIPEHTRLAGLVREAVDGLRGRTVNGVVVQHVEPMDLVFGYDPTFTPPLPRWVLATSMVARSNREGVVT
jgi:hypothetical protein